MHSSAATDFYEANYASTKNFVSASSSTRFSSFASASNDATAASVVEVTLTPSQTRWASFAFLITGIGVAMCWTSLQAGVVLFRADYPLRSKFNLAMSAAYNGPALPLLVLQATLDQKFDRKFGSSSTFTFRYCISFLILSASLCLVPFAKQTLCLVLVALVGVMDNVAFGTSAQFFSMFPGKCGGYYFIGASVTSIVSIAISLATGFAEDPTHSAAIWTFCSAAVISCVGFTSVILLIRSRIGQQILDAKDAVDSSVLLNPVEEGDENANDASSMTWKQLLCATKFCHLSLGLLLVMSTIVGSMVTYIPSSTLGHKLTIIAVYVQMIAALCGKQVSALQLSFGITSQRRLFAAIVAIFLSGSFYLFYISQKTLSGHTLFINDWCIICYLAVFSMCAAFLSSKTYALASGALDSISDKSQNSALLSITLTAGVYLGLGASFALAAVLQSPFD